MLGIKNVSINFSQSQGTLLPGYIYQSKAFGQDWEQLSPGLPFAFGSQKDIRSVASNNGWISRDPSLNTMYKTNSSDNLTLRSTIEPIKQFRIELTANKTTSNSYTEYYRWDDNFESFNSFSPTESGSFSISFISWKTAFRFDNAERMRSAWSMSEQKTIVFAKRS